MLSHCQSQNPYNKKEIKRTEKREHLRHFYSLQGKGKKKKKQGKKTQVPSLLEKFANF